MSLTPIEEGEGDPEDASSGPDRQSGVWALLGVVFFVLGQKCRAVVHWLRPPEGQSQTERRQESQLRVSGQRRLVSGTEGPRQQQEVNVLPEQTALESEKSEDSLRVYDPDREEAYVSSDTWQDVER